MKSKSTVNVKGMISVFMSLVYMALAYLVMFTQLLMPYNAARDIEEGDDYKLLRILLAIALSLYSLFRGYRAYRELKGK